MTTATPPRAVPAGSAGRRERKKAETRRSLRREAIRLAGERGYDHVTVEDIAEAVDVSTRTFFNYFASKEDALFAGDGERRARLVAALGGRPAGEPLLSALREAFAGYAAELEGDHDDWAPRAALLRDNPVLLPRYLAGYAEMEAAVADAVAERLGRAADTVHPAGPDAPGRRDIPVGHGAAGVYARLLAACACAALRVAVQEWQRDPVPGRLAALVGAAVDALAQGLPPPSGAG